MESIALLEDFVGTVVQKSGIPGMGVALKANGLCYEAAAGIRDVDKPEPLDTDAGYELGCLSKFFTAARVLSLVKQGRLAMAAPLSHYLPDTAGTCANVPLRSLLSHSAGYCQEDLSDPRVKYEYCWDEFLLAQAGMQPLFPSERVFNFSHSSYAVLGRLLETLSCTEEDHESKDVRPVSGHLLDNLEGDYRVCAERQYGSFWRASLLGGTWRLGDIVDRAEAVVGRLGQEGGLFHTAVSIPPRLGGERSELRASGYTFGLGYYGNGVYGINSSYLGQCCSLYFLPSRGIVLALGLNSNQLAVRDFVAAKLLGWLGGKPLPVGNLRETVLPLSAKAYAGEYQGAKGVSLQVEYFSNFMVISPSMIGAEENTFNAAIELQVGDGERVRLVTDIRHWSVSFFADPVDATPCILLGDACFRKRR